MAANKPCPKPDHWGVGGYAILGVTLLPCILASMQVGRALLFGAIYAPGERFRSGRDILLPWDEVGSVFLIGLYLFWGLGVPVGVLVGMWATRRDRY
ncbi:hypothetical protein MicloDRAFT_00050490 [Microvirga lotononidis]|uniref:Uncharacterized protein n=1 Tax=Microvirga lotononidis TaxID=864069 RepID=I4YWX2_9HYPH|nr:hypothetical protein MicloDRAFT_00050490 [Microvirga lotononidis]